jgi:small subunit ribosomal protein S15
MITLEKKQKIIADNAKDKKSLPDGRQDTGSPAVQVSILTARIAELTEHLKQNKKDFATRRGLLQMVGKRKRLLKYIARKDSKEYLALIKKLNIRR